jgi:hypothetical protein
MALKPRMVFQELAEAIESSHSAERNQNHEWAIKHRLRAQNIADNFLPSGAGWDLGTKIDLDKSNPTVIRLSGSFHHMSEVGHYCGWTNHNIVIRPVLTYGGIDIRITGRDRNQIKDYLGEIFQHALTRTIRWDGGARGYHVVEDVEVGVRVGGIK